MLQTLFLQILRPHVLASWLCTTVVAAFAGPFGTFETQTLAQGLIYWGLVIGVSIFIGYGLRILLLHVWPDIGGVRSEAAATLLFTATYTPVLWWITTAWFGGAENLHVTFPLLLVFVLLMAISVSVFIATFTGKTATEASKPIDATEPQPTLPPLLLRLPEEERGKIHSVCASDHYVHVNTDRGQSIVFMRFTDAIALLGDLDGVRVHRSYWVARDAAVAQRRSNGRLFLLLCNGAEVPVSRKYRPKVEARFTLPDAPASE